jgi:hypothetical protein
MSALFASGHIADVILAFAILEGAALLLFRHRAGRGIAPADLLPNLCSGLSLMLALRLALTASPWPWIALCLLASLLAHLLDLRFRWRA